MSYCSKCARELPHEMVLVSILPKSYDTSEIKTKHYCYACWESIPSFMKDSTND